jgi:hypothetical protein
MLRAIPVRRHTAAQTLSWLFSRDRLIVLGSVALMPHFDGTFGAFHPVHAGFSEAEQISGAGPMLIMTGVHFVDQRRPLKEWDWLMELVGNKIVPVFPLNCVEACSRFSIFSNLVELIGKFGLQHVRYQGDLKRMLSLFLAVASPKFNIMHKSPNRID